jgi:hypothetical protein
MAEEKKHAFLLPPAEDDVYLVVRIPKKDVKPGMTIGEIHIFPQDPTLGCWTKVCCNSLNI